MEDIKTENRISLTKKDILNSYFKWALLVEASNSYERLQALSFCISIIKPLRKLYPDDENYKESLKRHLQFYNSEGTFGSVIGGIVLSMEEEKANGADIPGEVITSIKTGLMGPMAGIGDTIIWGTIRPIIFSIGITMAMTGSAIGGLIPFVFAFICLLLGYVLYSFGYRLGRESVKNLLSSGLIKDIITGSSILGLFMMGSLSANYVKLSTPIKIVMKNADKLVVQDLLDQILPGMLPLAVIFVIYFYFDKKGQSYNKILLLILLFSILGAFIGLF
ncbi:MAG: PTS system mannose/fructose/sorbose family transporter subunit IID [Erysipelotrichaceae bacterium]